MLRQALLVDEAGEETDLYQALGVDRSASKAEIKKAYHKAALSSHPDKVAADERPSAEIKFKAVSRAYEILYDDDKRHLYDTHGMSAFDPSNGHGHGEEVDLNDILQQMFGMGGGAPPGFGQRSGPRQARKGKDEEQTYEVTLEELYRGKTAKFTSTKNVVCGQCKGSGGKDKAKAQQCAACQGKGVKIGLRSVGPGLVTQETMTCGSCKGLGKTFKEKDRCRRCKGNRVTVEKKVLEIYVPRGAKDGDRIVLEGEGDQLPDQEPGDIIFIISEAKHNTFTRAGADLLASLDVTLAESLTGFSRVVLKHLDGRGIHIKEPQGHVLEPGQVLKVPGEGMPYKKSDAKGDLYLVAKVQFPESGWLQDEASIRRLRELLPKPTKAIDADTVDEVDVEEAADLDDVRPFTYHVRHMADIDGR
ncbi:MAG: hypothetical protein M1817_005613 [Caeruleum heppii]|nr:MAG: hypothetical protein M1817_005613 [Caeruleum heppii]